MKLYIKTNNGQAIDHPIQEDNLLMAYPNATEETLAEMGYLPFVTVPKPSNLSMPVGTFQVAHSYYKLRPNGKSYHHVWRVRDMTQDEIADYVSKDNKKSTGYVDISKISFT